MDYDDLEKIYTKQFTDKCEELNLRKPKKDFEGIPTLYPRGKKRKWYCQAWGNNEAALTLFDHILAADGKTLHGKTVVVFFNKFIKCTGFYGVEFRDLEDHNVMSRFIENGFKIITGDTEMNLVFPLSKLEEIVEEFGFEKKKASKNQIEYRKNFGKFVKESKK